MIRYVLGVRKNYNERNAWLVRIRQNEFQRLFVAEHEFS